MEVPPTPPSAYKGIKSELYKAAIFRHACKVFDADKKISADDFQFILEMARLSPSSFGLEPWKFLIVQNIELREKLKDCAWGGQNSIPTASHVVLALTKRKYFMKYDSEYVSKFMSEVQHHPEEVQRLRKGFLEQFQKSDFNLLESDRSIDDWASKQAYIPLANMMTAAASIGIDSCPIEGFNMEQLCMALEQEFSINSEEFIPSYMVCFGYRAQTPRPKTRQKEKDVFMWFE